MALQPFKLAEGCFGGKEALQSPRVVRGAAAAENLCIHRLRLLVAEAVRYQKEHNSTALHRFVRRRLGLGREARALTPGLPAEFVRILLNDLQLVAAKDGPKQAFLQLIELPLWKVES
jgi:hypothetical protein